jgi:hypothetical protein
LRYGLLQNHCRDLRPGHDHLLRYLVAAQAIIALHQHHSEGVMARSVVLFRILEKINFSRGSFTRREIESGSLKMQNLQWIASVLCDLREFALENDLERTASAISQVIPDVERETGSQALIERRLNVPSAYPRKH